MPALTARTRLIAAGLAIVAIVAAVLLWPRASNPEVPTTPFSAQLASQDVVSPLYLAGGHTIEAAPPGFQRKFSPTQIVTRAATSSMDINRTVAGVTQLNLHFGIYAGLRPGPNSPPNSLRGTPVYVLSGDNRIPCGPGSGPAGGQAATQTLPGNCEWLIIMNADSGEQIFLIEAADVFCLRNPDRRC